MTSLFSWARENLLYRYYLPRIHFIEIHDQPWCIKTLRDDVTAVLHAGWQINSFYKLAVPFIKDLVANYVYSKNNKSDKNEKGRPHLNVIDMCSGGGGPAAEIAYEITQINNNSSGLGPSFLEVPKEPCSVTLSLTDLYPNIDSFTFIQHYFNQKIKNKTKNNNNNNDSSFEILFKGHSVDASSCDLNGIRTIYGSFHHFQPDLASKIFFNAQSEQQPIFICEPLTRTLYTVLTIPIGAALSSFISVLSDGRWSFRRLFFTNVIPVVPAIITFDAIMSVMRTYTPHEMCQLVDMAQQGYTDTDADTDNPGTSSSNTKLSWTRKVMTGGYVEGWYYEAITPSGYVWRVGTYTHCLHSFTKFWMPTLTFALGFQKSQE